MFILFKSFQLMFFVLPKKMGREPGFLYLFIFFAGKCVYTRGHKICTACYS